MLSPEEARPREAALPSEPPAPASQTPLMRQYEGLKARNPDAFLLFRLGDFYELFYEDARRAAPLLEVVLTQRQGIPMCGIPHHALAGYLAKLLKAGHRVALAEQMEDPSSAKGMVRRDVVRVVSPGTVLEEELLSAKQNNFLAAVAPAAGGRGGGTGWGLAALDMSTGEFLVTSAASDPDGRRLADELARLDPREVLLPRSARTPPPAGRPAALLDDRDFHPDLAERILTRAFGVVSAAGFGLEKGHPALGAAGAAMQYVERNQPQALAALRPPRSYGLDDFLVLDDLAIRHLDLLPPERTRPGEGPSSLWEVLDHTVTSMGGRKLKWWLLHPLRDPEEISRRQDRVAFLLERAAPRRDLRALLKDAADVERILGRLSAGGATGRDLNALRRTLGRLPDLPRALAGGGDLIQGSAGPLGPLFSDMSVPPALTDLLARALSDDPPMRLSDGGVIRDGYSSALDELRSLAKSGRSWISRLEADERQRTGISSLKIGYTSVFGYYLEVSRPNLPKVPPEWIRKQTLANAERFVTPDLKAQEDRILGAEDKARALEADLFAGVRKEALACAADLRRLAEALSELDALLSLAEAADRGRYSRPRVTARGPLRMTKARHPVVELALPSRTPFVPNDLSADSRDCQVLLITGPNMGGKSTYLRQAALIVVMAQMGSFVPAEEAEVGAVDRVFTRIGAGDNLAAGASTFLVEMQEVSNILHNATDRSLVILDEVGRGTSTYDGVAVAWAVIEHLHRAEGRDGPKVLFATHYFELTGLSERLPGVRNFHAAVREWTLPDGRAELVFLRQILPGPADRSYGVHVAQMAGLPKTLIERARSVLESLERQAGAVSAPTPAGPPSRQLDMFRHPALQELASLDPDTLTPLEALQVLHRLAENVKKSR